MKYLNRLKSEKGLPMQLTKPTKARTQPQGELTKPTKAPFVGFVSTEERRFSENISLPLPFFEADGSLVIPFGSESRYHWWKGGQSVKETIEEVRAWKH